MAHATLSCIRAAHWWASVCAVPSVESRLAWSSRKRGTAELALVREIETAYEEPEEQPVEEGPRNEYRLAESDEPVVARATVLAVCGTCGARLFPRVELVGRKVRCPDCFQPVLVPRASGGAAREKAAAGR